MAVDRISPFSALTAACSFRPKWGSSFLAVQSDSRSRENFLGLPFLSSRLSGSFCFSRSSLSFSVDTGLEADLISRASMAMFSLMEMPC